jgi:hypothetical protein
MSGDMPKDPIVGLSEAAVQMHELFVSFSAPGRFTEQQALYLVGKYMEGLAKR